MATIAPKTPPKSPWGVPLVLPHVLLSVGLLIFATMRERAPEPPSAALSNGTAVVSVSGSDPRRTIRKI